MKNIAKCALRMSTEMSTTSLQTEHVKFNLETEESENHQDTVIGEISPVKSMDVKCDILGPVSSLFPTNKLPNSLSNELTETKHSTETVGSSQETHEILNTCDSFRWETTGDLGTVDNGGQSGHPENALPPVPVFLVSDALNNERFEKPVPTLCYNGHVYSKVPRSSVRGRLEWECSKRLALSCGALVTTDYNLEDIRVDVSHCHSIVYTYIEAVHKASTHLPDKQIPEQAAAISPNTRAASNRRAKVAIEYAENNSSDESLCDNEGRDDAQDYGSDDADTPVHHGLSEPFGGGAGVTIKQEVCTDLNVEVLTNSKGGIKLFYKGYQYAKNKTLPSKIKWECSHKKKYKCYAGLVTDPELRGERCTGAHTHPVMGGHLVEVHKARTAMKECIDPCSDMKPREIFEQELAKCTAEAQQALLARKESILRLLRQRKDDLIEQSGMTPTAKSTPARVPVEKLTADSPYYKKKELIQSARGGWKLYFEGYSYTVKVNCTESRKKIRWECSNKVSRQCNGAVLSDTDYENVKMTIGHNHERSSLDFEVFKVRNIMKKRAYETEMTVSDIITEELKGVPEELNTALGGPRKLTGMLTRIQHEKALKREAEGGEPVERKKAKREEQGFVEDTPHWSIIFKKEILTNNRGGVKISYEGYMYTKKSEPKDRIVWECSQRRAYHCSGLLDTDREYNNARMTHPHTHERSTTAAEVSRIRQSLKDRILRTLDSPGKVLAQELGHLPPALRAQVGSTDSLKRVLRKIKHMALRGLDCAKVEVGPGQGGVEVIGAGEEGGWGPGEADNVVGDGEEKQDKGGWGPGEIGAGHGGVAAMGAGEEVGPGEAGDDVVGDNEEDQDPGEGMMGELVPLGLKETTLRLHGYGDDETQQGTEGW